MINDPFQIAYLYQSG